MKKLLFLLLVVGCTFAAKGVTFTEGDFTFSDEPWEDLSINHEIDFPSDNNSWHQQIYVSSYNGTSEHVVIPSEVSYEGISYEVSHIGPNAFAHSYNLKSVDLGSVAYIGMFAFNRFVSMQADRFYGIFLCKIYKCMPVEC